MAWHRFSRPWGDLIMHKCLAIDGFKCNNCSIENLIIADRRARKIKNKDFKKSVRMSLVSKRLLYAELKKECQVSMHSRPFSIEVT